MTPDYSVALPFCPTAGSHMPDDILCSENTQHWPLPTRCLCGNPMYTHQPCPLSTVTFVQVQLHRAQSQGLLMARELAPGGQLGTTGCWEAVCGPDLSCGSLGRRGEMAVCPGLCPAQSAHTSNPFTEDQPSAGAQNRADTPLSGFNKGCCRGRGLDGEGGREFLPESGGLGCQIPAWHHQDGLLGPE